MRLCVTCVFIYDSACGKEGMVRYGTGWTLTVAELPESVMEHTERERERETKGPRFLSFFVLPVH